MRASTSKAGHPLAVRILRTAATLLAAAAPLAAQDVAASDPPKPTLSMGQPPLWKPYMAGQFTWNGENEPSRTGGAGVVGLYKDLMNPMFGGLGVSLEGYFGGAGGDWDGGGRLFGTSRLIFLSFGVDYNAHDKELDFAMAFTPYFRRGGLFGTGGNFRFEWIPGRGNSFNVGFQIPLQKHMGDTRPVARRATLPSPGRPPRDVALPVGSLEALTMMRYEALWLLFHAQIFNDDDDESYQAAMGGFRRDLEDAREAFRTTDERHPNGYNDAAEKRHYDEGFDAAFVAAVGEGAGRAVSDHARDALLDEVLLPYDRLIGQYKHPDTLRGLGGRARLRLARALDAMTEIDAPRRATALAVFDQVLEVIEACRASEERHWGGDERKVWLPLDLALRSDQHDTQEKLDAIVERALGRPFTRGNAIFPTNSTRFLLELLRSIDAAEDYHVLWIHDYAGLTGGEPDPVAARVTAEGYLRALTRNVREFDRTGRIPTYIIFQTQWFYETNGCRLFLSVLEDPLRHELKLGKGHEEMERQVRAAQDELRQAVAQSKELQRLASERGEGYVRDLVKVHVNVTLPADLSFRSPGLVGFIPFVPDTVMLDHRKLFFYDVTEEDPRKGAAVFTGTGVGATYMSPTWEDRGILVSGPSLLGLKDAARELLMSQGFAKDEVPAPLQPKPKPSNYEALVDGLEAEGHRARGLNVHNRPGFAYKETTFAQSLLYTLAPKDTMIVVPDSIWASPLWAGQLAAAALRGCHVYAIAPSLDNSPAAARPVMARTREIFSRLLLTSQVLKDEIAAAGGHLRVGFYTREAPAGDTLAKIRETAAGLREHPFLLDEFPLPRDILATLDETVAALEAGGYQTSVLATGGREGRPKMHRKTQLFATRSALRQLADDPRAIASLRRQLDARAEATADPDAVLSRDTALGLQNQIRDIARESSTWGRDAVYYLTVGSKNQDQRSAFLDGETEYVVAGASALWLYSDFMFLMADTRWVDTEAEIDGLVPVTGETDRHMGRLIEKLI